MIRRKPSFLEKLSKTRNRSFFALDIASVVLSIVAGYVLRFDGWSWLGSEGRVAAVFILIATPCVLGLYWRIGMYRTLWRYASIVDVERLMVAAAIGVLTTLVLGVVVFPNVGLPVHRVPYTVLVIGGALQVILLAAPRLFVRSIARHNRQRRPPGVSKRALIVGAGAAGGLIVKELLANQHLGIRPVGLVDDDGSKHGKQLHGIPVLGALSRLGELVERTGAEELIIAIPTAPGRVVRDVVKVANELGVPTRTVPGVYEILSGRKSVSALRKVEIHDLLRRTPVETDLAQVGTLAANRTVLVTGAGGSIGSELCRQLARHDPTCIVAVGRGENSIFEFVQEFARSFPDVVIEPIIADVRNREQLRQIFDRYRPYSIFHAAAHKHVPLMESSVAEAVLNNVVGTHNVVTLAAEFAVEHFVLISTDKAIRPTSVMGVTKRIAEGIVHDVADQTGHKYVAVRFGNVLGSRGSVVPTFLKQIAEGGPVTITHPEMRRYFMTIPEAVELVLQAGAMAQGSEVFVLDMGEQVRVADLAADLIRLSGLEIGTDIEIRYTGIRPGEKLYEEMFVSPANALPTVHPKILRATDSDLPSSVSRHIEELIAAARCYRPNGELRELLGRIVPDYDRNSALPTAAQRSEHGGRAPVLVSSADVQVSAGVGGA